MVRIFGSPGRSRRLRTGIGIVASTLLIAFVAVPMALAIHDHPDRLIQLDRDGYTATNPTLGAEDWQNVCPASQPAGIGGCTGDTTADSHSFVTELGQETIYTGGGSKDINSISQWRHKTGPVTPKDDLFHGFAAREKDLLYFGGDRFQTQGTATFGVWFLQGEVAPVAGGTFSGGHQDGDLHIVADFLANGANAAVIVREWVGDDATGSLQFLAGGEFPVDCLAHPSIPDANSEFCATANLVNTNSPWAFQSSSGAANVWLPGLFFEGGIDLAALNLENRCFSNTLIVTRSSNQPTAQLKDFVAGELESCDATVTTTPSDANGDPLPSITLGDEIHDYALIAGEDGFPAPTGDITFFICAPAELTAGACATGGTEVSTNDVTQIGTSSDSEALSDAFEPTSVGTWCWRGEYNGDGNYDPAEDASTGECFTVTDIASTSTAQSWLPQDTATIVSSGGSAIAGTVDFSLYESANCSGDAVQTFLDRPVSLVGTSYQASTNNATYYTTALTISWRAVFTSSNSVASGDASHCETMTVSVLNNDLGS